MKCLPFLSLALAFPAAAQVVTYTIHEISQPSWARFQPWRVNSDGLVVGHLEASEDQPFAWTMEGGWYFLPLPQGYEGGRALDVNEHGVIVGYVYDSAKNSVGVVWPGDGAVELANDLVVGGTPHTIIEVGAINDHGHMACTAMYNNGFYREHADMLIRGSEFLRISPFADYDRTHTTGLNNQGEVCGLTVYGGYRWKDGEYRELIDEDVHGTTVRDINSSGVIVGEITSIPHWVYDTATIWNDVEPEHLQWGKWMSFNGINDSGRIVGHRFSPYADAIWSDGQEVYNLEDSIVNLGSWDLLWALDISNSGYIIGEAQTMDHEPFILVPNCRTCENVCTSLPNSTGFASTIALQGWDSLSANHFRLEASQAPSGVTGLFLGSTAGQQVPFGNGFLCVDGAAFGFHRLTPSQTAPNGVLRTEVDLWAQPYYQVGSTWTFQGVFRDPNGGGALTWNGSDALRVTFKP